MIHPIRDTHPCKLGDEFDGSKIIATYNVCGPGIPNGVIGVRGCEAVGGKKWLLIDGNWVSEEYYDKGLNRNG